MPAERTPTKASELRRSTKPIMEKRRRARINNSLTELKTLILDALKKDNARHSKLEKADILEMTVKHLQQLQRQQRLQPTIPDPDSVGKFRAGFGECAAEVSRYLNREQADDVVRQRLLGHLANCLTSLAPATPAYYGQPPSPVSSPNPHQTALPTVRPTMMTDMKPVHVQVPADHLTIGNGLQLVATKLPSGEIAFLLPSKRDSNNTTSVITHAKQRCPVNVLGSSGILSPAASDRSSPSPSSPLTVTMPYHGVQPVFEPISPVPSSSDSVWRPW